MITAEMYARFKLMDRRRSLLKLYEENTAEAQALRQTVEPDWVDRARDVEDETVLAELSERERRELGLIDDALARIASGDYGRCEDCDEPIERERLAVMPEARRCLGCGMAAEKR